MHSFSSHINYVERLILHFFIVLFFSHTTMQRQKFLFDSVDKSLDRNEYMRRIYGEPFSTFWKVTLFLF